MVAENAIQYTLGFLIKDRDVLMLHRNKPPNQGLWNGVGGRIEPGEDPVACILREIYEETGCRLPSVRFAGCLTWEGFEIPAGGLYIFTAEIQEGFDPTACDEGHLAWKSQDWVLSSPEVVSNIHRFGPAVFTGEPPVRHHFVYYEGEILQYQRLPILNEAKLGSSLEDGRAACWEEQ